MHTKPRFRQAACCAALVLLGACSLAFSFYGPAAAAEAAAPEGKPIMDDAKARDWLARWEKNITGDARNRYCDKEMGEELGWLISPFLNGFYYGYMATKDPKWIDQLDDWAGSLIKRGVKGPENVKVWVDICQ